MNAVSMVAIKIAERFELVPRSAMLNSRYRLVRWLGRFGFTLLMLMSVRRTKWYLKRGAIPVTEIASRPPSRPTTGDVDLCRRLIESHRRAQEASASQTAEDGMWSWIFDARQRELAVTLKSEDPERLAELLASMFRSDFVLGMAAGPLIQESDESRMAARAWEWKCLDALASLAEYCGTVPVEALEQGQTGIAFQHGLAQTVDELEGALGFRLDFPKVGGACGLVIEDRIMTPDTPDQIYAALRLEAAIQIHLPNWNGGAPQLSIVEIGGGYGGMCYWIAKRGLSYSSYTIVDLPIVNVLQGYFLGKAFGPDRISLFEEAPAEFNVLPAFALDRVEVPFQVLVNKDSLPEMPSETMRNYLRWGSANCDGLFYSYNQETGQLFMDEPQGIVHQTATELGGFTRVRRDRGWVREGYVEEVYLPRELAAGSTS